MGMKQCEFCGENDRLTNFCGSADLSALRAELEKLKTALKELHDKEPADICSAAHDRWEERKELIQDRIFDIEDEIIDLESEMVAGK